MLGNPLGPQAAAEAAAADRQGHRMIALAERIRPANSLSMSNPPPLVLDPRKFADPLFTATGERRAVVAQRAWKPYGSTPRPCVT
jgi:hypothetical protein